QSLSRIFGPPWSPLAGFLDMEEDCGVGSQDEPISSTEQRPIPYAFRNARFTARVSATRISAPWTRGETLDGSALPYPTKPLHACDLYTVALKTQRDAAG